MTEASDAASLEAQYSAGLVKRIGEGDLGAEDEMVKRYARGLLFLLGQRTRDHELAQDLRQETFRIAIEKLRAEPIDNPECLGGYLRGVAVKLVSANWRKTARQATIADSDAIEQLPGDDPGPLQSFSRGQVADAVRALLAELTVERDREILTRFYLEEQDKDEICRALSLDSMHFNRVHFRAKQRFRALLLRSHEGARLTRVK